MKTSIEGYTQYAWAGEKYETTKSMRTSDIAKLIRKDIENQFPSKQGWKFSVRTQVFAGGSSVDISLKEAPIALYDYFGRTTDQAREICREVQAIADEYRYSDSDGMIDYFCTNFYAHCQTSYDSSQYLGYQVYNPRWAESKD